MIAEHGVEREDGTVAVGYNQADLRRLAGLNANDGRIYGYVRDLGDAVVCRRGQLILDRHRLAELERSLVVSPLSRRTVEVGARLSDVFGRATADGTVVLSVDTVDGVRPARLVDLGTELGMSRSSTHRHLRALRAHSDSPTGGHSGPAAGHTGPAADDLAGRVALLEDLAEVDDQIITGLTRRAELRAALRFDCPAEAPTAEPDRDGDFSPVDDLAPVSRPDGELRAGFPANCALEGAIRGFPANRGSQDQMREEENPSSSLIYSQSRGNCAPENPRQPRGCAPENPREAATDKPTDEAGVRSGGVDWDRGELLGLCGDLLATCERHDKPGPSNLDGLIRALVGRSREEIGHAQKRIACDMAGGRISSPFGLLAAAADDEHDAHRVYFPRRRTPTGVTPALAALDDEPDVDTEAVAAVTALIDAGDTDTIAALDQGLAGTRPPRVVDAIRNDPAALLASRVRQWRALHPGGTTP